MAKAEYNKLHNKNKGVFMTEGNLAYGEWGVCEHCNGPKWMSKTQAETGQKKYCSSSCQKSAMAKRHYDNNKAKYKKYYINNKDKHHFKSRTLQRCLRCGEDMWLTPTQVTRGQKKYCPTCKKSIDNKEYRRINAEYFKLWHQRRKKNKQDTKKTGRPRIGKWVACKTCGGPLWASPSQLKLGFKKFCNNKCRYS